MKKNMFKALSLLALSFLFAFSAHAQAKMPMPSPSASVSQLVGFTEITIDYSSPGVKGRKVFGELEKWGVTWRAGANAATKVTFSTGVKIGDKDLRAGSYTLFITPMENEDWVVHINSKGNSVFTYMKDGKIDEAALAADDAVSIKVKPVKMPEPTERLMYYVSAGDNKVGEVGMLWADYYIAFDVDTKADAIVEGIKKTLN
ncbi:DUF2911 domain-containing protein [Flammeovirgaceae bacterium SG7u.111]|nr:DUF2911 domain-containing protein [Flammeovirgaceae bacterium SG7u.132]WPO33024.1 DUF2911 domain-containing protein [Flammeovirgaceae bacterium SG7u.111]